MHDLTAIETNIHTQPAGKRKAVVILGMHRSGTSALAGVVRLLGVTAPKTLMSPNIANESGFWESVPLVSAHDELLSSAASRWDDWRQFNPDWTQSDAAQNYRTKIRDILLREYGDSPLFFIKDPRICRFAPFTFSLLDTMDIEISVLVIIRNPLEVALSLWKRDGIALQTSFALWLRHTLDAEYHSRALKRCFLTYDDLLIDWRGRLDSASDAIDVEWPYRPDFSAPKIAKFLSHGLRHQKQTDESLAKHPSASPLVMEAYRTLRAMAAGGENQTLADQLDKIREQFENGCRLFWPMLAAEILQHQSNEHERLRVKVSITPTDSNEMRAASELTQVEFQRVKELLQHESNESQRLRDDLSVLRADLDRLATKFSTT